MNPSDYIALVRLSTLADETLAMPGDRCTHVPASSIPYLLANQPPQVQYAPETESEG